MPVPHLSMNLERLHIMNPPPDKHPMHLIAPPELTQAFLEYIAGRDIGPAFGRPFDKQAATEKIFSVAMKHWDPNIVYIERCAATFVFYIKVRTQIERATAFIIHLTINCKADSNCYTKLVYCDWGNKLQCIADGTSVTFNQKGLGASDGLPSGIFRYNFKRATVLGLEVASHLGDKMYEYYNIQFDDGAIFTGISGFHLQ